MSEFIREFRYVTLKLTDIYAALDATQLQQLKDICAAVSSCRIKSGKPPLECVVIEGDWPEYEATWKTLEDRMKGER